MKKKLYSFLLAAFLATASLFAADIAGDLKMHYTFDQVDTIKTVTDTVPSILDQTSNHLDGIAQGTLSLTKGYGLTGKAFAITDTMNKVKVPGTILEGVTDFTVAFWINQNALVQWSRIFDFGSNRDHYMYCTTDEEFLRVEMAYKDEEVTVKQFMKATTKLQTKVWNHVAIVADYTVNTGVDTTSTFSIYINGTLAGTTTDEIKIAPYMIGATTHSRIGGGQWQDPTANSYIDDFRFYTRAFTQDDLDMLTGITPAHKAAAANFTIPLVDRTEIVAQMTLPSTTEGFDIIWASTDSTVIKKDGTPQQDDIAITDAFLLANITAADGFTTLQKRLFVSVYPKGEPIEILAQFNFLSENIIHRNDSLIVKDEGEVGFEAFTVGGAQILTIGAVSDDPELEGEEYFNVYVSGNTAVANDNATKQWLDLGRSIGDYIYKMRDHSISIFYRRDTTVDHKTWSDEGQLFWAFSNTNALSSGWGGEAWGAMYFEPNDARVVIMSNASEATGNYIGWGTGKTPLGDTWHNVSYTQTFGTGYLVIDAVQVATGPMLAPKEELRRNSNVATRTGTWYNRLGGSVSNSKISAKNTMLYGFSLYTFGMGPDEIDVTFKVTETIEKLNVAMENTTYNINDYMALLAVMPEARKTLKIGFMTDVHTELLAAVAEAVADSTSQVVRAGTIDNLKTATQLYKDASADWIKMAPVLDSFDDERALAYPGLAILEQNIATVQTAYNNFEIEVPMFAFLDSVTLDYLKSQIATSTNPANYTFKIVNPSFEVQSGGTKDPNSSGGNFDAKLPLGWTILGNTVETNTYTKTGFNTNKTPTDGITDFETWAQNNTHIYRMDASQVTKENLPAGWYVLSGDVRSLPGTRGGQHMYVLTLPDSTFYKSDTLEADKPGIAWPGGYDWDNSYLSYKKVFVLFKSTDQKVKIAFHTDTAVMKMDNVKLAYFGSSDDQPTLGDLTSYIKNAGFEAGARATELEGFDAASTATAAMGNLFAPLDWNVLATVDAAATQANINLLSTGSAEGANAFRFAGDTLRDVKLYQSFYAPSSGMYKLNAYVRADSACRSDARLFAKVGPRYDDGLDLMGAVDTSLTFTGWKKLEYTFRAAVTDPIELGLVSSGNVDVDNFKLELYSNVYVGIKDAATSTSNEFKPYAKDGIIYIPGLKASDRVSIYDIAGRQISVKNPSQIKVSKGMYMIKINNEVIKQLVK